MSAAELLALAKDVGCEYWPNDGIDKFAQAAEVLELIAWAEEGGVSIERKHGLWWATGESVFSGDTIIDTLRRAREAAR